MAGQRRLPHDRRSEPWPLRTARFSFCSCVKQCVCVWRERSESLAAHRFWRVHSGLHACSTPLRMLLLANRPHAIVVIVLRPRKRGNNESATRHIAREYPGATLPISFSQTCLRRPAPRKQNVPSVRRRVLARGIAAHPVAPTLQRRACSLALETVVDPHARPPRGRLLRVTPDPRQHAGDEDEGPAIQCSTHVICRREKH